MPPLRTLLARLTLGSIAVAMMACTPSGDAGTESAAVIPASPATPTAGALSLDTLASPRGPVVVRGDSAPGAVGVSADPLQWKGDDVVSRLRQGGLAPTTNGTVDHPEFGTRGLRVTVADGAGEVRAFVFGDANAVALAQRRFDPARVPGMPAGHSAMLLVDNNLAAIVIAADPALGRRIAGVLRTSPNGR